MAPLEVFDEKAFFDLAERFGQSKDSQVIGLGDQLGSFIFAAHCPRPPFRKNAKGWWHAPDRQSTLRAYTAR
jgi:hypothetical protein